MINEFKMGADAGTRRAPDNLYLSQGGPGIRLVIPVRIPIESYLFESPTIPTVPDSCPLYAVPAMGSR